MFELQKSHLKNLFDTWEDCFNQSRLICESTHFYIAVGPQGSDDVLSNPDEGLVCVVGTRSDVSGGQVGTRGVDQWCAERYGDHAARVATDRNVQVPHAAKVDYSCIVLWEKREESILHLGLDE